MLAAQLLSTTTRMVYVRAYQETCTFKVASWQCSISKVRNARKMQTVQVEGRKTAVGLPIFVRTPHPM